MEEFTISAGVLHELLTGANASAAGVKEYRAHLACVQLAVVNGVVTVAGTQGTKLAVGDYVLPDNSGIEFITLWHVSDIKHALPWLKSLKGAPVVVSPSLLKSAESVIGLTPQTMGYPNVMAVIPNEFPTPLCDTMPAFIVDPSLLADMAKIPNTAKRVEIRFNHVKHASLAEWANESGVSWRYVFMRKSA